MLLLRLGKLEFCQCEQTCAQISCFPHAYEIMNVLDEFSVFAHFCMHEYILMFLIEKVFQTTTAKDPPFPCPFEMLWVKSVKITFSLSTSSGCRTTCSHSLVARLHVPSTWRHLLIVETSSLLKLSLTSPDSRTVGECESLATLD